MRKIVNRMLNLKYQIENFYHNLKMFYSSSAGQDFEVFLL